MYIKAQRIERKNTSKNNIIPLYSSRAILGYIKDTYLDTSNIKSKSGFDFVTKKVEFQSASDQNSVMRVINTFCF